MLDELSADEIFINTGTRAVVPPLEGLERIRYYTNSTLLELTELPAHLVIVGGSYIALEFAQMFRRFGSRVTVLVRGERVLTREDADFAESVQKVLAREGVEFRFGVQPSRVEPHPHRENEVCIGFEQNIPALEASHLLFATGREPNTDDLGLDAAGIATDKHGTIPVDGQLRTNVPGIWAIGDVNGRGAFTHTSYDDFQIVAANLLDGGARSVDTRIMAYAVFVDPPLARVGTLGDRGAQGRPRRADRHHADDAGGPRARTRRNRRLHEGAGRRAEQADSRRGDSRHRRRRGDPHVHRHHDGGRAVHDAAVRDAHSSDHQRTGADLARRTQADEVSGAHSGASTMKHAIRRGNLFDAPRTERAADEQVDTLVEQGGVSVERIVSMGHASPPGFWYDSPRAEWVVLLSGAATLEFEGEADAASDEARRPCAD